MTIRYPEAVVEKQLIANIQRAAEKEETGESPGWTTNLIVMERMVMTVVPMVMGETVGREVSHKALMIRVIRISSRRRVEVGTLARMGRMGMLQKLGQFNIQ